MTAPVHGIVAPIALDQVTRLSPRQLLMEPGFWGRMISFLLNLVVGVLFLALMFWITLPGSDRPDNMVLYLWAGELIFALAPWALWLSMRALAEITVNRAIAVTMDRKIEAALAGIRAGSLARPNLMQLEQNFLPDNRTQPVPAMVRLFQRICEQARDRRFESAVGVIQPYRDETMARVAAIESVQRTALRLGILGTFVGLMMMLPAFETLFRSVPTGEAVQVLMNRFAQTTMQLSSALRVAFGTSVAGLSVALFVALLSASVRREQSTYFQEMEDVAISMLAIASNAINEGEIFTELSQLQRDLRAVADRVYQQTKVLGTKVEALEQHAGNQATYIGQGVQTLTNARKQLDSLIDDLRKSQEASLGQTKKMYEEIKQIYDAAALTNVLRAIETNVATTVTASVKQVCGELQGLQSTIGRIEADLRQGTQGASNEINRVQESLKKIHTTISTGADRLNAALGRVAPQLETMENMVNRAANTVSRLTPSVGRLWLAVVVIASVAAAVTATVLHVMTWIAA
jgi:cob(I)alamin adenosyltransferase